MSPNVLAAERKKFAMKISNVYTREKAEELEVKVRHMLTEVALLSGERQSVLEIMLNTIDYEELYLGISLSMHVIYGYIVHAKDPVTVDFRCNPLFSQYGCLLMEIPGWDINVTQNDSIVKTKEVWVLQDMSLVTVECCGIHCNSTGIGSEYRNISEDVLGESFKKIKLFDLMQNLQHYAHYRKYVTDVYHIVTEDI